MKNGTAAGRITTNESARNSTISGGIALRKERQGEVGYKTAHQVLRRVEHWPNRHVGIQTKSCPPDAHDFGVPKTGTMTA
jgi:hypothetical protein